MTDGWPGVVRGAGEQGTYGVLVDVPGCPRRDLFFFDCGPCRAPSGLEKGMRSISFMMGFLFFWYYRLSLLVRDSQISSSVTDRIGRHSYHRLAEWLLQGIWVSCVRSS